MISKIAYFSAEWGFSNKLPTYAGGLGILAADILKESADSNFPMVGIGLFYHEGFFRQKLDAFGNQIEQEFVTDPRQAGLEEVLDPATGRPLHIEVGFPAEPVAVKVWQKQIGQGTPLFLLDADLPVNKDFEQKYTAHLYEGEWSPFLEQEFLLGVGGVRLLRTLNIPVSKYHINDDHAAPSILERLREGLIRETFPDNALVKVKNETIFTTHTPVVSAVSKYPVDFIWPYLKILFQKPLAENLITKEQLLDLGRVESRETDQFSFSVLAFKLAGKVNAVSKRHQQTSKKIWHFAFPQIKEEKRVVIDYVTNAVHPPTWIAKPMDEFFRKYLGKNYQKEIDNPKLWERLEVQDDQQKLNQNLWQARLECKERLFEEVRGAKDERSERKRSERFPDPKSLPFFLGFARRFAPYKRVYLLISDLDRLSKILTHPDSPIYLFVAGKAHPADPIGKKYLKEIIEAARDPRLQGHLIFLPDYNLELAKILIPGVDVWLNTPLPPMEASGTSGMKAALNGVLNACVADGWWWETQIKNQKSKIKNFGWTIGSSDPPFPEVFGRLESENDQQTAAVLYDLLETQIVPLYYDQTDGIPLRWIEKIKKSLITLAPQFNTQRLLKEYQERLYK